MNPQTVEAAYKENVDVTQYTKEWPALAVIKGMRENAFPRAKAIEEEMKMLEKIRCWACGGYGHNFASCATFQKLNNFSAVPTASKVLKTSIGVVKKYVTTAPGKHSTL